MERSKLIIVEGAQGVGKTTCTDFIRHSLKHINLYRLSGIADNSPTGLMKNEKIYYNLMEYLKGLENCEINLLFDRTFFSEENYCRAGFKEYSFTDVYNKLVTILDNLDFDIYYITLYLKDTNLYEKRLQRKDKVAPDYAKFKIDSSIKQQNIYLEMAEELKSKSKNIKVYNVPSDDSIEIVQDKIREILSF